MTKFQLVGAIFLFVICIYALVLGIKFLLSRNSISNIEIGIIINGVIVSVSIFFLFASVPVQVSLDVTSAT